MRLLVILLLACSSLPGFAANHVTVERLEQVISAAQGKPDGKVADQLEGFQLIERVSSERLLRWEKLLPGRRSREALVALADSSAFYDLPASEIPALAVPDTATQNRIFTLAARYAGNVIHQLPNFFATRETTYFEDTPSLETISPDIQNGVGLHAYVPLRVVDRSSVQVTYRDGREVVAAAGSKGVKDSHSEHLSSTGEFGPILAIVMGDALRGAVSWSHWEQGAGGPEAVLRYAVPQAKSRYKVFSACEAKAAWLTPAYHGEMAVEPATGNILRLTVVVDMPLNCQVTKVENLVEYGPVEIGGIQHICPIKSVSVSELIVSNSKASAKVVQTQLNDVSFSGYHLFEAQARVLTEADAGNPSVPAESAQPKPAGFSVGNGAVSEVPATTAAERPAPGAATSPAAVGTTPSDAPSQTVATVPTATPPASLPQEASTAASASEPSLVLHANANLVLVDVVVTDHSGDVHGLDQSRFRIFQDGHEQPIASFDEHQPPAAQPGASVAANRAPLPLHTFSNAPHFPQDSTLNVLLLDALNTPMENQGQMRQQVVEYLTKAGPGASFAIFTLGTRLQLVKGFTGNSAELIDAVNDKQAKQQSALLDTQSQFALNPVGNELATGGMVIALIKQQLAQVTAEQTDVRVRTTLDALNLLAAYLGGIPGRKNLIWLSGSFPIALDPNDQLIDPLRSARQYTAEVRRTNELLAAARVAVYPVDARGVMTATSGDASNRPSPNIAFGRVPLPQTAQDDRDFQNKTQAENASMEKIADETGGKAFIHDNDLKGAVEAALANGSSYYTVGYVPPPDAADGKFHKLRVSVEGKGLNAAYRSGYYAKQPGKLSADDLAVKSVMASASTFGGPPATQVLFQARVLDAADPLLKGVTLAYGPAGDQAAQLRQPTHRCVAELTIDAHSISFEELPDGKRKLRLEVALVAFGFDGKRENYLDRNIELSLNPTQLASIMTDGVRARVVIDVPPGQGILRMAVEDLATARAGSLEVTSPAESK
jgi:VWFA-related protein